MTPKGSGEQQGAILRGHLAVRETGIDECTRAGPQWNVGERQNALCQRFRLFRRQKLGGNVVFVASKNGLASSPNASAYCTAKAAEIHLARCLALEGADAGIRVNTVNPDAVLRGSKIWNGEWREQRAASSKIEVTDLEEHYRNRSMLKLNVFPEDIAEAIYFLASDLSAKSTGNIINVDAGNAQSVPRGSPKPSRCMRRGPPLHRRRAGGRPAPKAPPRRRAPGRTGRGC